MLSNLDTLRNPPPLDPAKREHTAQVVRVKWHDRDSGFGIYELRDGHTAKGRSGPDPLAVGGLYRFLGRWRDDPKWGPQFWFDSYIEATPAGRTGVIRYLTKLCDGIGERSAARLYDAYAGDAVRTLREDPARVVGDGLLSAEVAGEASSALAAEAQFEATKLDLFDLFAGRGFHADALIPACIAKWRAKAPAVIRRNPFALMQAELPSCGFRRCDALWQHLGLRPLALKRQMWAAWYAIHTDGEGHTWHDVRSAVRAARDACPGGDGERAVMLGIRARKFRHRRDAAGKLWVAEAAKASAEQTISASLARLMRCENAAPCKSDCCDTSVSKARRNAGFGRAP